MCSRYPLHHIHLWGVHLELCSFPLVPSSALQHKLPEGLHPMHCCEPFSAGKSCAFWAGALCALTAPPWKAHHYCCCYFHFFHYQYCTSVSPSSPKFFPPAAKPTYHTLHFCCVSLKAQVVCFQSTAYIPHTAALPRRPQVVSANQSLCTAWIPRYYTTTWSFTASASIFYAYRVFTPVRATGDGRGWAEV